MELSIWVYYVWLIVGALSFVLLIALLIFFGRLMWLQVRIWMLAGRGYHLIEHVGLNKVRTYYYLKPNDNKFDFKTGYYLHQPDAITKTSGVLPKTPPEYGSFKKIDGLSDSGEYERLEKKVTNWNYTLDAVTLRWGIPILTYVGNDANPVNFTESNKRYSAQVIRDIYIRLLATQQFNFLKKLITVGVVALVAIAIGLFLLWQGYKGSVANTGMCISNWNATQAALVHCVEISAKIAGQNSTVIL